MRVKEGEWGGEDGMIGRFEEGKKQLSTPFVPIPFSSLNKMTGQRAKNFSYNVFKTSLSHT
jgi:hypothetical protein